MYSSVIKQKISGTELSVEAKVSSITTTSNKAFVGLKTKICGATDNATFVGNKSKAHREIRKKDYTWAKKINTENRAYYMDVEDSLENGYDGCSYCLHEHHSQ